MLIKMNELAERILQDLKNTFKKDPLIDEFHIIPVHESVQNKCPVLHIDHKVALEDWCVKHVYVYAYTKFFEWRTTKYKIDFEHLITWASMILLINPDIETVWNARKELVCQNVLTAEKELTFSAIVLSRKPKCSAIYAHRKWLISRGCSKQIADREREICDRAAEQCPTNYYAWSHRAWLLQYYSRDVLIDELERTEKWIWRHISDHCGFHHRQFVLSSLPASRDLLMDELQILQEMQKSYEGHESLWYHRRYILLHLQRCSDVETKNEQRLKRHKLEPWEPATEEAFLKSQPKNNTWEKTLIDRHIHWLYRVLSWKIRLT